MAINMTAPQNNLVKNPGGCGVLVETSPVPLHVEQSFSTFCSIVPPPPHRLHITGPSPSGKFMFMRPPVPTHAGQRIRSNLVILPNLQSGQRI